MGGVIFLGSSGLATGLGLAGILGLGFSGLGGNGLGAGGMGLGGVGWAAAGGGVATGWVLGAVVRATSTISGGFSSGLGSMAKSCQACQMPVCRMMEIRLAVSAARTGRGLVWREGAVMMEGIRLANKLMEWRVALCPCQVCSCTTNGGQCGFLLCAWL